MTHAIFFDLGFMVYAWADNFLILFFIISNNPAWTVLLAVFFLIIDESFYDNI